MTPRSHADEPERDDRLGAALSGLPVPDHGPTFWADLIHRIEGEPAVPSATPSATDLGPTADPAPIPLDDRRARRAAHRGSAGLTWAPVRGPRTTRSLGAAAAAVALVVAAAGALSVIRQDDDNSQVATGGRPTGTTQGAGPAAAASAPAEFSATYDGIEGWDGPDGCCSTWRLTLARDGSYRWSSTDGGADMAYDATTGRHVEIVTRGVGASPARPNAFVTTGVPAGGPDRRVARPDPLDPIGDVITALARAGDPRITTGTVAGRATWHYDGPTVQDRLGGDGAPNHAVADVDQASGVLLQLTRRVDDLVVTRFTAGDITVSDRINRARYELAPPPEANTNNSALGFVVRPLDEVATVVPYDLLVPRHVPDGFTLDPATSVAVNRDVPSPTGPEGGNPPTTPVVSMTWRRGADTLTVTLRPTGSGPWDDPLGAEGMVADSQPVRLDLADRPPLEGSVTVDAPLRPHLWGITGDIVVTVSGDLPRAELEMVAGSLRRHEG